MKMKMMKKFVATCQREPLMIAGLCEEHLSLALSGLTSPLYMPLGLYLLYLVNPICYNKNPNGSH